MDFNKIQQICLSQAVKILGPKSGADRKRCRNDILRLISSYRREFLPSRAAKSREQLKILETRLAEVVEVLENLEFSASYNLFTPENIENRFSGNDEYILADLLKEVTLCSAEARNFVPRARGGRVANFRKRRLAHRCQELFERWRPGKAKKSSKDFLYFVDLVNFAAGGKVDESFERALKAPRPSNKPAEDLYRRGRRP